MKARLPCRSAAAAAALARNTRSARDTGLNRGQMPQGACHHRSALISAKVLERELDPRIEDVRRAYQGTVLALATLMGDNIGPSATLARPEGDLAFVPTNYNLPSEIDAALKRRPDLNLARLLIRVAEQDQTIIEAAYYPMVEGTLSGTYIPITIRRASGGTPNRADDIISSEGIAGVGYTWRVIDNGRIGGQVARARSVREMNEISLHRLESNVSIELQRIARDVVNLTIPHHQPCRPTGDPVGIVLLVEGAAQQVMNAAVLNQHI